MKKIKKFFVLTLTVLLAAGMFPMSAFAGDEPADMTSVSIKGHTVTLTTLYGTAEAARANTYELALTLEEMANSSTPIAITDPAGADAQAKIYSPDTDGSITGAASGLTGTIANDATSTAALPPGTVIWLIDGNGSGAIKVARVLINQKADGTIDGSGTVKNPIYNVALPTTIDFALNPLQIGDVTAGSQITSANYESVHKSTPAVKVSFTLTAALDTSDSVTFVNDPSTLSPSDVVATEKKLYFGALSASDDSTAAYSTGVFSGKYLYDAAEAATLVPFDPTTKEAELAFLLQGGTGAQVVDGSKGNASFQFYANLNTYAAWDADDVSVSGAYTLQGVRADDYTALTGTGGIAAGSLNLLAPSYPGPGFIVGGTTVSTVSAALSQSSNTDVTIPFFADGAPLTGSTLQVAGSTLPQGGNDFDLSGAGLVLKLSAGSLFKIGIPGSYPMTFSFAGHSYTVNLTLTS
jgi:hypothetical protein